MCLCLWGAGNLRYCDTVLLRKDVELKFGFKSLILLPKYCHFNVKVGNCNRLDTAQIQGEVVHTEFGCLPSRKMATFHHSLNLFLRLSFLLHSNNCTTSLRHFEICSWMKPVFWLYHQQMAALYSFFHQRMHYVCQCVSKSIKIR
jgi:hypothetical protein